MNAAKTLSITPHVKVTTTTCVNAQDDGDARTDCIDSGNSVVEDSKAYIPGVYEVASQVDFQSNI